MAATSDAAQETIQQAQALLGDGRPAEAKALLGALLRTAPDNLEAQYAQAVALRHLRRWRQALTTLAAILEAKPDFGRAHQEVGYNQIARKQFEQAEASFEQAVAKDPALVNSWRCLAKLHRDKGNQARLTEVRAQIAFLEQLPPELLAVITYLSEGKLADADRLCRHFLRSNKTHVEGMRLLAEIGTRNKVFEEAEFLLESCLEFQPDHRNARMQYASLLLRVQKFAKAYEQAKLLMDGHPEDVDAILSLYAAACSGMGRNELAVACYERLMAQHPQNHLHPISLAHVLRSEGALDQAVAHYQRAYQLKPDHGAAYWSLANTKSYAFSDAELQQMQAAEANPETSETDRIQLCFALGAAYEDRGDYQRSFRHYSRGNALKQASAQHSAQRLQARIDSQIEVCTPKLFADKAGLGFTAQDAIFIVGLPRAGSTLLEQILSSHSQVDGTLELHNILNLAKRLRGRTEAPDAPPRYPRILSELEDSYFRRFGEQFINDTRAYRGDAPYFIDKMPNNFFHLGLIKLILPNAKVIDARRSPMACCFGGFKQLFGEGQEFSYGLREIQIGRASCRERV